MSALTACLCSCIGSTCAALFVGFVGFLYLFIRWDRGYFERRGIKSVPGELPFIGHTLNVILQREPFFEEVNKFYRAYPDKKYVGVRQFRKPLIMLRDVELIKKVTIKDFDHFQDHIPAVDDKIDPLFGSNLIFLKGEKWRNMRSTLSPAFTSSRMRGMFEFVAACGQQMANFFDKEIKNDENKDKDFLEIELKEIFTRYANDVIATSAFGLEINSLEHKNNSFYEMGKKATDFSGFRMLRFFVLSSMPRIMKLLNIRFFKQDVADFFKNLVSGTMKAREEQNIIRHDMIHILMEAKKGVLKHDNKEATKDSGFATVEESELGKSITTEEKKWTDDEITAQAIIFFFAGFDTVSTLLCFLGYELTKNPDIQKKLQQEIDVTYLNNGKVTYNDLQHMKYMDMVVSETLRFWPPSIVTDRNCVKVYTLPPSDETTTESVRLQEGDGMWIPIYSIHHDPKYYENPEKFDPDRFSDENKSNINPLTYIPFGIGPRSCIGSRFALMEVKSLIFYLLKSFDLVVTSKTEIPLKFKKNSFNTTAENGFWIGLKPRQN